MERERDKHALLAQERATRKSASSCVVRVDEAATFHFFEDVRLLLSTLAAKLFFFRADRLPKK